MKGRQGDPLANFKQEIESMFEKSFQELTLKNNLNKTILSNLMQAAKDQQHKIAHLDRNIESLKMMVAPQTNIIKTEVNRQEELIYDNFNRMMGRLNNIQQGISNSRRNMQQYIQSNAQITNKLDYMSGKLQKIEREEGGYQYRGNQQDLMCEVEDFQKILIELQENSKNIVSQIDFNQKIHLQQPLSTFQTKMTLHNKNNEQVLRTRLKEFTEKLKKIEKRVQQTTSVMSSQFARSGQQQKRIIEQMNMMEGQMGKLRNELEDCDIKRKQAMQSSAATLDNLVEQMLVEAKKLEVRVDSLRKGYEDENQRLKKEPRR